MTSSFENKFLFEGIPTIIGTLEASKYFPSTEFLVDHKIQRLEKDDNPCNILKNTIVPSKLNDFISDQIINDNCFILAEISISKQPEKHIDKFSFHSIITENHTLQECISSNPNDLKWTYYRLDFAPYASGLFIEDIPHLHTRIDGPPRVYFPIISKCNPLICFIDFIYRNHFYGKWKEHIMQLIENVDISESTRDIIASSKWPSGITQKELHTTHKDDIVKIKNKIREYNTSISRKFLSLDDSLSTISYNNMF